MQKRVPAMRPGNEAADLVPVAVDTSKTIHLVKSSKAVDSPSGGRRGKLPRARTHKRRRNQRNGMTRTLALAGEAFLAPLIWLGNARLLWLDRK